MSNEVILSAIDREFGLFPDTDKAILEEIKRITKLRANGNFNNMLPFADVRIPESVLMNCPMARQHFIQAKNCPSCKHYNGIVQTTYNDEYVMNWASKFAVSCGCPVDRKCSVLSIEGVT